jgi:soluble lytic murein transglycosylase
MSRLPVLVPLSLVSALTLGGLVDIGGPGPEGRRSVGAAVPDSAIEEFEAGRFWHAARILEAEPALDAEGRLWLARAQSGYRHWEGVLAALDGITPEAAAVFGASAGELWSLRALALDESDRDVEADAAWARAIDLGVDDPAVAWARRARIALAALPDEADARGRTMLRDALVAVDEVAAESPLLAAAVAAEAVSGRAEAGDTAGVRMLMERAIAPFTPSGAWETEPTVLMAAGDSARAIAAWDRLLDEGQGAARRGRAHEALGDVARARGDDAAAADHYLSALRLAPGTDAGRRAARGVVDLMIDEIGSETAHDAARALDRLGDGRRALAAYDRYMEAVAEEGVEPDPGARVERARIAVTVPSRQEEAIEEFRALDEHPDPAVGVRTLTVWAGVRQRQGQTGNYQTLRSWLIERYPDSDEAAEIVYLRADAAQDRGALDSAIGIYEQVIEMAPSRTLAGQARMRVAQIHLGRGDLTRAADVYEEYLADFPTGRRWEEAAYWAARLRLEGGDTAGARTHIERLRRDAPLTYYSVRASALVGEQFGLEQLGVPNEAAVPNPLDMPILDQLEAAGLAAAADRWVDRRADEIDAADGEGEELLRFAEALNARGRTLQGINLGWRLREQGMPWSRRLVEVIYPFIYREMVIREAAEWGLDPVLVSALIRQESAWVADIRSSAGAIGLMQVMPATGAQVARADGMNGFSSAALETPEVNLHLGARFLSDLLDRYGEDLPLVLSAYNAGPSRADRWRAFPEAADRERFTERIPFAETRGYVKNVTRNVELYEALYGDALRPVTQ